MEAEREARIENLKGRIRETATKAAWKAIVAYNDAMAAIASEAAEALDDVFARHTCAHCGSACSWRDDGGEGCYCGDGEC